LTFSWNNSWQDHIKLFWYYKIMEPKMPIFGRLLEFFSETHRLLQTLKTTCNKWWHKILYLCQRISFKSLSSFQNTRLLSRNFLSFFQSLVDVRRKILKKYCVPSAHLSAPIGQRALLADGRPYFQGKKAGMPFVSQSALAGGIPSIA
jgi:hypothetical protein